MVTGLVFVMAESELLYLQSWLYVHYLNICVRIEKQNGKEFHCDYINRL